MNTKQLRWCGGQMLGVATSGRKPNNSENLVVVPNDLVMIDNGSDRSSP
jgi:hypothetical protein